MLEVESSFYSESFLQRDVSGFPLFVRRSGFGHNKDQSTYMRIKSSCLACYESFIARISPVQELWTVL